ncbi:uncharacterized protein EURHEDRAFT_415881 [Aspergillus ruber CBS 135680]|uniref:Uncharacterized protein n=1 Tax=Aspergillus ruber (strain CBS 135680) TaxID=1388766 RepID=A0A017S4B8_ASPRC|nr:uncharacterized protein EURHEDRAFT_415881 [Aspergillus ruber CBS 135680]EYE91878.1 hypothetical protein EURHEDRAFT_415881 [Aspergillus ruber CBS 135680]
MEKERKKLGLPALHYLVCEGGSCPILKQAKVYKHLALLVNACTQSQFELSKRKDMVVGVNRSELSAGRERTFIRNCLSWCLLEKE